MFQFFDLKNQIFMIFWKGSHFSLTRDSRSCSILGVQYINRLQILVCKPTFSLLVTQNIGCAHTLAHKVPPPLLVFISGPLLAFVLQNYADGRIYVGIVLLGRCQPKWLPIIQFLVNNFPCQIAGIQSDNVTIRWIDRFCILLANLEMGCTS